MLPVCLLIVINFLTGRPVSSSMAACDNQEGEWDFITEFHVGEKCLNMNSYSIRPVLRQKTNLLLPGQKNSTRDLITNERKKHNNLCI